MAPETQSASNGSLAESPQEPQEPPKLEREELLEFLLIQERANHANTKINAISRELQQCQIEAAEVAKKASDFLRALSEKYGVSFHQNVISADGYILPKGSRH